MKSVLLASTLLSTASAFTSTIQSHSTSALKAMPERLWDSMVDKTQRSKAVPFLPRAVNLDGSLPGDQGFDPMYLSSIPKNFSGFIQPPSWEETNLSTIYWMREAELKHSRVAMLAWAGWVATDMGLRFPGSIYSVESIPTAYEAHNALVAQGSMAFMLIMVGIVEFCTGAVIVEVAKGQNDRAAGDFKFDPLNFLKGKSEAEKFNMRTKEINNGRLAMLAFGGVATQTALENANHAFPYF